MVNGPLPHGDVSLPPLKTAGPIRGSPARDSAATFPLTPMSLRSLAKSSASAVVLGMPEAPGRIDSGAIAGDASSATALARLESAITEIRALSVQPLLRRAVAELRAERPKASSEWALKALQRHPESGLAWYILAIAREKVGDFASSVKAYESALALLSDEADVTNDLGRLAFRMGLLDVAEQLFRRHLAARPGAAEATNNLACVVRDLRRSAEAIEILKPAIKAQPDDAALWNTLGSVLAQDGDMAQSIIFFDEALRLNPSFSRARYNRGNSRLALGDLEEALVDCDTARAETLAEDERLMMQLARSTIQMCRGHIGEGWDDYEARLDPRFPNATHYLIKPPRWTPEADLAGKTLLLMGEQGLGDEVLFANILPDVIEALGPKGKLYVAVEPRLVTLFQRSFPSAEVVAHTTYQVEGRTVRGSVALEAVEGIDLWAPIGSLLRRFRRTLDAFPSHSRFLIADPQRVEHWRRELAAAPAGHKVGILWKSMKIDGPRSRFFSPFELWAPVLKVPGVSFVNVQYGDCADELAWAARNLGVGIWTPPEIDLKNDLDDVAALCCALDLTIGFANATSNIAAACGGAAWIISAPAAWPRLGTNRMPWYPQVRGFCPATFAQWEPVLGEVAAALSQTVQRERATAPAV